MPETDTSPRPVLLHVSPDELDLVVEALRSESSRRQRAATRAARELATEVAEGRTPDKRPGSVRIVSVLQMAGLLDAFADNLVQAFEHPPQDGKPEDPEEPEHRGERPSTGSPLVDRLLARKLPGDVEADEVTTVEQDDDDLLPPEIADPDAEPADPPDVIALGEPQEGADA